MQHYDVIIVGSGMVGLTLANLLQKNQFSVCIIEASPQQAVTETLTARVSAIHPHSRRLLQYLNCWEEIPENFRAIVKAMHVWDHTHNAIDFDNEGDPLAWIVNNHAMVEALREKYTGDYICPDVPQYFSNNTLILQSGKKLSAELIVGADGAHSWVRKQMCIAVNTKSYDQKSIIAVIASEKPHENIAYQHFLKTGPVALLPLSHAYQTALVWSADTAYSDNLMKLSEEKFSYELTRALAYRLGELRSISERSQFTLTMRHAKEYGENCFVLVGDAAHTIHPLAGLGVNLGLMDVACLSQVLCDARDQNKTLCDYTVLRRYTRWRKAENTPVLLAMRGLQTFFALDWNLTNVLRGLGMASIDHFSFIKKYLIRCATGSEIELPLFLQ
ncbi:MAG: hypothetical protein A3E84_02085 [Gammaproteobacteria bacterium RIFCSPHIGHO2_12_FULL_42_13]|nr:MAG: hypothetical protein A3E84_02085 [Gammaproteobacteria bacterium RIFCSPHIGHO2_12_FULL_42_13]